MTVTWQTILRVVAVVCFAVAFIITADWVTAEGAARDSWFIGGSLAFAASFLP